jgi:hypothetical protein
MNEQLNEALIQLEKDLAQIHTANELLVKSGNLSIEMTAAFKEAIDNIKDQMQSIEAVFSSLVKNYETKY